MDESFALEDDIGAYIREERREQGMTMRELGQAIGLTEQAVSQYELGKRPVKYSTVMLIMKKFGMTLPAFLDKYNLYDEQIPEAFNGDVDAYHDFQDALQADHDEEMLQDALVKLIEKMTLSEKEELFNYGNYLMEKRDKKPKGN